MRRKKEVRASGSSAGAGVDLTTVSSRSTLHAQLRQSARSVSYGRHLDTPIFEDEPFDEQCRTTCFVADPGSLASHLAPRRRPHASD
jgi:hypothetical protein